MRECSRLQHWVVLWLWFVGRLIPNIFSLVRRWGLVFGASRGICHRSNTFVSENDYFERHDFGTTNPRPKQNSIFVVTNLNGDFAWASEHILGASTNPLGSTVPGILHLKDLTVTGFTDLKATVSFRIRDTVKFSVGN